MFSTIMCMIVLLILCVIGLFFWSWLINKVNKFNINR